MKYIKKFNEDMNYRFDQKLFITNLEDISKYTRMHPDYFWELFNSIEGDELFKPTLSRSVINETIDDIDFDMIMNWVEIKNQLEEFTEKLKHDFDDVDTEIEINDDSGSPELCFLISHNDITDPASYKHLFDEIIFLGENMNRKIKVSMGSKIELILHDPRDERSHSKTTNSNPVAPRKSL